MAVHQYTAATLAYVGVVGQNNAYTNYNTYPVIAGDPFGLGGYIPGGGALTISSGSLPPGCTFYGQPGWNNYLQIFIPWPYPLTSGSAGNGSLNFYYVYFDALGNEYDITVPVHFWVVGISGVSPTVFYGNSYNSSASFQVTGYGFTNSMYGLYLGTTQLSWHPVNDNVANFSVIKNPGIYPLHFQPAPYQDASGFSLDFLNPITVTGISPPDGPGTGGTSVIISGTGFANATLRNLLFDYISATGSIVNDRTISAVTPVDTNYNKNALVDVVVETNINGTYSLATLSSSYLYTYGTINVQCQASQVLIDAHTGKAINFAH
jgi:hypothetical protein